jgi:hypothetical protein
MKQEFPSGVLLFGDGSLLFYVTNAGLPGLSKTKTYLRWSISWPDYVETAVCSCHC